MDRKAIAKIITRRVGGNPSVCEDWLMEKKRVIDIEKLIDEWIEIMRDEANEPDRHSR